MRGTMLMMGVAGLLLVGDATDGAAARGKRKARCCFSAAIDEGPERTVCLVLRLDGRGRSAMSRARRVCRALGGEPEHR